jgi:hypothetical protein
MMEEFGLFHSLNFEQVHAARPVTAGEGDHTRVRSAAPDAVFERGVGKLPTVLYVPEPRTVIIADSHEQAPIRTEDSTSNRMWVNECAGGILRDCAAVAAALTLPQSQGQVEGQVNRLKLLKRQAYGRANLDLLRLRLLYRVT